jgi:hypothetical protein
MKKNTEWNVICNRYDVPFVLYNDDSLSLYKPRVYFSLFSF